MIKPSDLVTLKKFEAGFGWYNKIRGDIKGKYFRDIVDLDRETAVELSNYINGKFHDFKPYPTVEWIISTSPLKDLEIFFMFDNNPEFGKDLFVFFDKRGVDKIPSEDVYVFTQSYLSLISRYRKDLCKRLECSSKMLTMEEVEREKKENFSEYTMGKREDLLKKIKYETAKEISPRIKAKFIESEQEIWGFRFSPLYDLDITYKLDSDNNLKILYNEIGVKKYILGILIAFTWLYANEIIREAQKIDNSIPRISRYI
ncbi:MAG: hypothetical protein ACE5K4_00505 [Candidatus Hydrothermarchaeota archaeon]